MSRSRRGQKAYLNHLSTKKLGRDPTSWREFLTDIGPEVLKMYPVQQQTNADCYAFAPKIAITLQTGHSPYVTKEMCAADGGEPAEAAQFYTDHEEGGEWKDVSGDFGIRYKKDKKGKRTVAGEVPVCRTANGKDKVKDLLYDYLREGAVVLGIQNCGYPEWIDNSYVGFTYNDNGDAHALCIIGFYNDATLGPCFVSKCSNKPTIPSTGKFIKANKRVNVGDKKLNRNFFSLALLPLNSWLCQTTRSNPKYIQAIDGVLSYPLKPIEERIALRAAEIQKIKTNKGKKKLSRRGKDEVPTKQQAPVLRRSTRNRKNKELPKLKF